MGRRIVFMGTPDFAVPSLIALKQAGHEIAAVYTRPPQRQGRGMKQIVSPVHAQADHYEIEVQTPDTLKSEAVQAQFAAYAPNWPWWSPMGVFCHKRFWICRLWVVSTFMPLCCRAGACCADSACHYGGRQTDRHCHYANGGGAGYWPGAVAKNHANRRR